MSLSKIKWWYLNNCLHFLKRTVPLDLIEADKLKPSSALIYCDTEETMYTWMIWLELKEINGMECTKMF